MTVHDVGRRYTSLMGELSDTDAAALRLIYSGAADLLLDRQKIALVVRGLVRVDEDAGLSSAGADALSRWDRGRT